MKTGKSETESAAGGHVDVEGLVNPGEALRALDGLDELVSELLVGLVGRQVQPVEAGVGPGIVGGAAPLLYGEQLGTVRPVQFLSNSLIYRYLYAICRHRKKQCCQFG